MFVLLVVAFITVGGVFSFIHMPVDAYPDLCSPIVEISLPSGGGPSEEVERLVTVPTEDEMNGVPQMSVMRSISLYGLSDVSLTFDEGTERLLCAPGRVPAAQRGHLSHGSSSHPRTARKPIRTRLSICSRKPRPNNPQES